MAYQPPRKNHRVVASDQPLPANADLISTSLIHTLNGSFPLALGRRHFDRLACIEGTVHPATRTDPSAPAGESRRWSSPCQSRSYETEQLGFHRNGELSNRSLYWLQRILSPISRCLSL